jgi:uncharacterized membrane protein YdjX (TVP38/TMEM64 family)
MLKPSGIDKSRMISLFVITLLVVIGLGMLVIRDLATIEAFIIKIGFWGIALTFLLYGVLGLTIIPSEPLTILMGALFGPWIATLVAGLGNTLAAVVEYYLGDRVAHVTNFVEKKSGLPFGLGKLPIDSPVFLLGARMIPGYGPKIVSVLSGAYRVPILLYVWTTAVVTFLGAAIFAFGGSGLFQLIK